MSATSRSADLLGIVGKRGSGKDTVAQILEAQHGYSRFSLSDRVHDAIDEWGLGEHSRNNLKIAGTRLRELYGEDYLIDTGLAVPERPLAISGIYSPREVAKIHNRGGIVLAVVADDATRQQRIAGRARAASEVESSDFAAAEKVDDSGAHLALTDAMAEADFYLENQASYSLEDLGLAVGRLLERMRNGSA